MTCTSILYSPVDWEYTVHTCCALPYTFLVPSQAMNELLSCTCLKLMNDWYGQDRDRQRNDLVECPLPPSPLNRKSDSRLLSCSSVYEACGFGRRGSKSLIRLFPLLLAFAPTPRQSFLGLTLRLVLSTRRPTHLNLRKSCV